MMARNEIMQELQHYTNMDLENKSLKELLEIYFNLLGIPKAEVKENGKDYIVFSKRLAKTLINCGFELKEIKPNRKRPKYDVYLFADSLQLRETISKITSKTHQRFSIDINY